MLFIFNENYFRVHGNKVGRLDNIWSEARAQKAHKEWFLSQVVHKGQTLTWHIGQKRLGQ
jgi:hypothetical protein